MAILPCDVCSRRFPGPAGRAYISILDGGKKWEHKPRLCPEHYADLITAFDMVHARVTEDAVSLELGPCFVCHQSVSAGQPYALFATCYPPRDEREDFFAPICREHRAAAEVILKGTQIGFTEALEASVAANRLTGKPKGK